MELGGQVVLVPRRAYQQHGFNVDRPADIHLPVLASRPNSCQHRQPPPPTYSHDSLSLLYPERWEYQGPQGSVCFWHSSLSGTMVAMTAFLSLPFVLVC